MCREYFRKLTLRWGNYLLKIVRRYTKLKIETLDHQVPFPRRPGTSNNFFKSNK